VRNVKSRTIKYLLPTPEKNWVFLTLISRFLIVMIKRPNILEDNGCDYLDTLEFRDML